MAEGYLIAHVYTSDGIIPIPNATVSVTQRAEDGSAVLLAVRRTDISGRIGRIAIPTPERSQSQAPEPGAPFSVVDVTADHPNYDRITVENTQIFPGITTDQNFMLIPSSTLPTELDKLKTYFTPPQDL